MPPRQIPIEFEDEPVKAKSKKKMQSEEDWTPKSAPATAEPSAPEGDSGAEAPSKPKPKRVPRGRKPRATRSAEAPAVEKEESGQAAEASPEPVREESPDQRQSRESPEPRSGGGASDSTAQDEPVSEGPGRSESRSEGDDSAGSRDRDHERDRQQHGRERDRDRGHSRENFRNNRQYGEGKFGDSKQRGGGGPGGKKKKKKKGRYEGDGGGGRPAPGAGAGQPAAAGVPDPSRFRNIEELDQAAAEASTGGEPVRLFELYDLTLHDLTARAREMGIVLDAAPNRRTLVSLILEKAYEEKRPIIDRGALELAPKGYGFIVRRAYNYRLQLEDSYVAESFIRRYGLKKGHQIEAQVRPPEAGERCPAALKIVTAMDRDPAQIADITPFEDLVPYYPLKRMLLEVDGQDNTKDVSMRAVDLLTPIGFGQRGLIVAPPRTGKTVLLQQIANSVAVNNPEAKLIVLLIDERPEEVTDFRRNTRGEVVSSTFDEPAESHVQVAEMVIEKARRIVEAGEHVVILLDSITRLARAYNTMMPSSGKILSGGVEANALQKPKRFFGAARNIEGGGSLTIMATALIDTGSRMDEVIFEEFKGTGNMELHLDRALVDKRVFPALNIEKSGTRKEELLYHPDEMERIYSLRRAIQGVPMVEAMEMLVQRLKKTRSNVEFLMAMNR